jgi:hypothetical protein
VADADSDWSVMVGFVGRTLLITFVAYGFIGRQFCVGQVFVRVSLAAHVTFECVLIDTMSTPNLSIHVGHLVYMFTMIARRVFTDSPLALWIVFLPDFIAMFFTLFMGSSGFCVCMSRPLPSSRHYSPPFAFAIASRAAAIALTRKFMSSLSVLSSKVSSASSNSGAAQIKRLLASASGL